MALTMRKPYRLLRKRGKSTSGEWFVQGKGKQPFAIGKVFSNTGQGLLPEGLPLTTPNLFGVVSDGALLRHAQPRFLLQQMVLQRQSNTDLQFRLRYFVVQPEHDGPVVLIAKGLSVYLPEGGHQFAGALEIHRVLVWRLCFPVHPDGTALFNQVAGLAPFQGLFQLGN